MEQVKNEPQPEVIKVEIPDIERDRVLSQAVEEGLLYLRLTPDRLRALKEKGRA